MKKKKDAVLAAVLMAAAFLLAAFLIVFLCTSAAADDEPMYYCYDGDYYEEIEIVEELSDLYAKQAELQKRQETAHTLAESYRYLFPNREDGDVIVMASQVWFDCQRELLALDIPEPMTAEEIISEFLTNELGLNRAAVCGVLGNLWEESHLSPTAHNGNVCYGLCQWTGTRCYDLQYYCLCNGKDYTTMSGQLWFLKSELENGYSSVLEYLESVPDTAEGAKAAASYFCKKFEIPANTNYQANRRAANALEYYNG